MTHTVASGYINKMADENKGVTNGLYVSFYYCGGTLGSILPGVVYENYNWNMFLVFLGIMMFSTILLGRLHLRQSD